MKEEEEHMCPGNGVTSRFRNGLEDAAVLSEETDVRRGRGARRGEAALVRGQLRQCRLGSLDCLDPRDWGGCHGRCVICCDLVYGYPCFTADGGRVHWGCLCLLGDDTAADVCASQSALEERGRTVTRFVAKRCRAPARVITHRHGRCFDRCLDTAARALRRFASVPRKKMSCCVKREFRRARPRGLHACFRPELAEAVVRETVVCRAVAAAQGCGVRRFLEVLLDTKLYSSSVQQRVARVLWCGLLGLRARIVGRARVCVARQSPGVGVNRRRRSAASVSVRLGPFDVGDACATEAVNDVERGRVSERQVQGSRVVRDPSSTPGG